MGNETMGDETQGATLSTASAKLLLKLAKFLQEMPRAKFDFSTIMDIGGKPPLEALKAGEHKCGTVGCAVGWMPAVWPKALRWDGDGGVLPRSAEENTCMSSFDAATEFLGIQRDEVDFLFLPGSGYVKDGEWLNNNLSGYATPKAVARHIRKFVRANYVGKAKLDFA